MFNKVKEVYPLPGMGLSVVFANGTTKTYDVRPLTERFQAFKALEDEALFGGVAVDTGGYGVIWNDDLDLSCDELWENGVTEKTPSCGRTASRKRRRLTTSSRLQTQASSGGSASRR